MIALSLLALTVGTWLREPLDPLGNESPEPAPAATSAVGEPDFVMAAALEVDEPLETGATGDDTQPVTPVAPARTVPSSRARAQAPAGSASNCDPSFPDFCIAPGPDLDCAGSNEAGPGCTRDFPDLSSALEPPPAPVLTQCDDGADNDGDGELDLLDPGCSAIQDDSEGG